jgi:hypothetical protein
MKLTVGQNNATVNYRAQLALLEGNKNKVLSDLVGATEEFERLLGDGHVRSFFSAFANRASYVQYLDQLLNSLVEAPEVNTQYARTSAENLDSLVSSTAVTQANATRIIAAVKMYVYLLRRVYDGYKDYFISQIQAAQEQGAADQSLAQISRMYPNRALAITFALFGVVLITISLGWFFVNKYS